MRKRTIVDLLILLIVLVGGFFAVKNARAIGDWWYFRGYTPTEDIAKIADDAGMSELGTKLFYRMDPQFVKQSVIREECGSAALGCTVKKNIYILRDFTPKQYNRSVVTAAHEMLHVAWNRLSKDQISELKSDLDKQFDITEPNLMKKFDKFTGDDYYNEAHSYIGSEAEELTPELESHYNQYFSDRSKTLDALRYSPES